MIANTRDDDWQDEAGSIPCYLSVMLQSWLTREERQMAARINMTYARPEQFQPSCGTSDPSIMQASDSRAGKCQSDQIYVPISDHDAARHRHAGHHDAQHHVALPQLVPLLQGGEINTLQEGGPDLDQRGKTTLVEISGSSSQLPGEQI